MPESRTDSETAKKAQALREAAELGCTGAHRHPDGTWMACSTMEEYERLTDGEKEKSALDVVEETQNIRSQKGRRRKRKNKRQWEKLREQGVAGIDTLPGGGLVSAKGMTFRPVDGDTDVFDNINQARRRARQLGCIGVARRISRSGRRVWTPCTNMTDYARATGSTALGRRYQQRLERQRIRNIVRDELSKLKRRKKRLFEEVYEAKGIGTRIGRAAALFDPNAWDGDGDMIVQEGTPWERPAIPGVNTNLPGMPRTRFKPSNFLPDTPERVAKPTRSRSVRGRTPDRVDLPERDLIPEMEITEQPIINEPRGINPIDDVFNYGIGMRSTRQRNEESEIALAEAGSLVNIGSEDPQFTKEWIESQIQKAIEHFGFDVTKEQAVIDQRTEKEVLGMRPRWDFTPSEQSGMEHFTHKRRDHFRPYKEAHGKFYMEDGKAVRFDDFETHEDVNLQERIILDIREKLTLLRFNKHEKRGTPEDREKYSAQIQHWKDFQEWVESKTPEELFQIIADWGRELYEDPDNRIAVVTEDSFVEGILTDAYKTVHHGAPGSSHATPRTLLEVNHGYGVDAPEGVRPASGLLIPGALIRKKRQEIEANPDLGENFDMWSDGETVKDLIGHALDFYGINQARVARMTPETAPTDKNAAVMLLKPEVAERSRIAAGDTFNDLPSSAPMVGATDEQIVNALISKNGKSHIQKDYNTVEGDAIRVLRRAFLGLDGSSLMGESKFRTRYDHEDLFLDSWIYQEVLVRGSFGSVDVEQVIMPGDSDMLGHDQPLNNTYARPFRLSMDNLDDAKEIKRLIQDADIYGLSEEEVSVLEKITDFSPFTSELGQIKSTLVLERNILGNEGRGKYRKLSQEVADRDGLETPIKFRYRTRNRGKSFKESGGIDWEDPALYGNYSTLEEAFLDRKKKNIKKIAEKASKNNTGMRSRRQQNIEEGTVISAGRPSRERIDAVEGMRLTRSSRIRDIYSDGWEADKWDRGPEENIVDMGSDIDEYLEFLSKHSHINFDKHSIHDPGRKRTGGGVATQADLDSWMEGRNSLSEEDLKIVDEHDDLWEKVDRWMLLIQNAADDQSSIEMEISDLREDRKRAAKNSYRLPFGVNNEDEIREAIDRGEDRDEYIERNFGPFTVNQSDLDYGGTDNPEFYEDQWGKSTRSDYASYWDDVADRRSELDEIDNEIKLLLDELESFPNGSTDAQESYRQALLEKLSQRPDSAPVKAELVRGRAALDPGQGMRSRRERLSPSEQEWLKTLQSNPGYWDEAPASVRAVVSDKVKNEAQEIRREGMRSTRGGTGSGGRAMTQKILAKVRPEHRNKQDRTLYFIGGTTGAGKSSLVNNRSFDIPGDTEAAHIDPDFIKTGLVGWDPRNPTLVHEASRITTNGTMDRAMDAGMDMVVQGTGKRKEHLYKARKGGYNTVGHFVYVPDAEADRRIAQRKQQGGAAIPPYFGSLIAGELRNNSQYQVSRQITKGLYDEFFLWDNTGDTPRLVAFRNKDGHFEILGREEFDDFFGASGKYVEQYWRENQ